MAAINDLHSFWKLHKAEDSSLVGDTKLIWLAPDLVEEEEGFNLRDYDRPDTVAHIERLAEAWASGDQMPPLEVKIKDGRCFVRDGHCRLRAAKLANSRGAGVRRLSVIELKGSDDVANIRLLTSNDSLKLTPIQRAVGYQRLRNMGWEILEIAKELKTSDTNIRETMKLLTLPQEVQAMIEDGIINAQFALKMYRIHGATAMVELLNEAIARRTLEEETSSGNAGSNSANDEEGSSDGASAGAASTTVKQPLRITTKDISLKKRPLPRTFMKQMVPQVSQLRSHLMATAKPDTSGNVAVKIPVDVYESFMKLASMVDEPDQEQSSNNEGDSGKQMELQA